MACIKLLRRLRPSFWTNMATGKDRSHFKRGLIIGICLAVASATRIAHLVSVSIGALSKVTSVFRFRQNWMSNCPLGNVVRDQNDSKNNHICICLHAFMCFSSVSSRVLRPDCWGQWCELISGDTSLIELFDPSIKSHALLSTFSGKSNSESYKHPP